MGTTRGFYGLLGCTFCGLALAAAIGYYNGGWHNALLSFFGAFVLALLEISLSIDNALVNARFLAPMAPIWRKRFLTWGMLISVFGMRVLFPLLIVSVVTSVTPVAALKMALFSPQLYIASLEKAQLSLTGFGSSFLLLVALSFFFDKDKKVHWVKPIESWAQSCGGSREIIFLIWLCCLLLVSYLLPYNKEAPFLTASLWGAFVFLLLEILENVLTAYAENIKDFSKAGAIAFLYLEVIDASFSLDGVIGAFAIASDFLIIVIGLAIGAFYVRYLTISLVKRKTLSLYIYLEHGAFYAILLLAVMMWLRLFFVLPDWLTGGVGILLIAVAFFSSRKRKD